MMCRFDHPLPWPLGCQYIKGFSTYFHFQLFLNTEAQSPKIDEWISRIDKRTLRLDKWTSRKYKWISRIDKRTLRLGKWISRVDKWTSWIDERFFHEGEWFLREMNDSFTEMKISSEAERFFHEGKVFLCGAIECLKNAPNNWKDWNLFYKKRNTFE